jgi:hypothetical protein
MDVDAWWAHEGLEQQLLQAVDSAAGAVYQLPHYIGHPALAGPLHFAAIDSYLVNLRLLMDFWDVRRHNHDSRDFYATDFVPDWVPAPADSVESLRRNDWWAMASQQIIHMSRQRVVPDPHDPMWSTRWETNAMAADELKSPGSASRLRHRGRCRAAQRAAVGRGIRAKLDQIPMSPAMNLGSSSHLPRVWIDTPAQTDREAT